MYSDLKISFQASCRSFQIVSNLFRGCDIASWKRAAIITLYLRAKITMGLIMGTLWQFFIFAKHGLVITRVNRIEHIFNRMVTYLGWKGVKSKKTCFSSSDAKQDWYRIFINNETPLNIKPMKCFFSFCQNPGWLFNICMWQPSV